MNILENEKIEVGLMAKITSGDEIPNCVSNKELTIESSLQSNNKQLYYYLTKEIEHLDDYLNKYGQYKNLRKEILKIESENKTTPLILKKLLINKIDNKSERNIILPELPTTELIEIFKNLIKLFNVDTVYDMYISGIISSLLVKNNNQSNLIKQKYIIISNEKTYNYYKEYANIDADYINFFITDDILKSEEKENTMNNSNEISKEKKTKMAIFAWIDNSTNIKRILRNNIVDVIIILGEYFGGACLSNDDEKEFKKYNYNMAVISGKQIACVDYFLNDKYAKDDSCRSKIIILYKKSLNVELEKKIKEMSENKLLAINSFINPELENKYILQDGYLNGKFPKFATELKDSEVESFFKIANNFLIRPMIYGMCIPTYVKDLAMLEFLEKEIINYSLPTEFTSVNEFYDYYDKMTNIELTGLHPYKIENKIPIWIKSVDHFKKFIYLFYCNKEVNNVTELEKEYQNKIMITTNIVNMIEKMDTSRKTEKLLRPRTI